jgi:hypothetical protein
MKNLRILIIDTDMFSLSKLYFGLMLLDYTVEACNNPSEITERAERFQPNLVVLGSTDPVPLVSLCHYFKQLGVHLILVGFPPDQDPATLPSDAVLEKPVSISLLHSQINTLSAKNQF